MSLRLGLQTGGFASGLVFADQSAASNRTVTGTGAAAAQAAIVAGLGDRGVQDVGTDPDFYSQDAQVAGAGIIERIASGTPQAQDSSVAGAGAVGGIIAGSGAAAAQSATAAGSAERVIPGSGTPGAQSAAASGA